MRKNKQRVVILVISIIAFFTLVPLLIVISMNAYGKATLPDRITSSIRDYVKTPEIFTAQKLIYTHEE